MKALLILILLLMGTIATGQKSEIPSKVKKSFDGKFTYAENLKWTKDKEAKTYSAHFYQENIERQADFNTRGAWLHTSTYLQDAELPKQVIDEINYNYLNDLILFSEYRVTANGEKLYIIKLKPDGVASDPKPGHYLLIFSPEGNLISRHDNMK